MSTITLLTQKVTQLAQTVNSFISNSKKIEELPNQDSLDLASLIHVSRGGVSEKLELQLLATALSNNTFNRIISIGGDITVVDNNVTVPAITWSYDNVTFSIATDSILSSPYTSTGTIRTDIIVVKNNGTIELIQGNETEGIAIRPQIPAGAILVTQINVTDSGIGSPTDPLIGDAFVKKSFAQAYVYPDITGADASIPIPASGASQIILTNASLTSIACLDLTAIVGNPSAEAPYPNKIIEITNSTGNDVELKHATGSGIQFFTKDGLSIVIPNKESLYVKYNDDGAVEAFKSWSSGGSTPLIFSDTTFYTHTGTTATTVIGYLTIPANTISDGDVWELELVSSRNDTNFSGKAYVGAWIVGIDTIANAFMSNVPIVNASSNRRSRVSKSLFFKDKNVRRHKGSGSYYTDLNSIPTNTIDAIDLSVELSIGYYLRLSTDTDTANLEYVIFRKIN